MEISDNGLTNDDAMQASLLAHQSDTDTNEYRVQSETQTRGILTRYVIAIWAFLGFCCLYALRVNLSVAIVAMTKSHVIKNGSSSVCLSTDSIKSSSSLDPMIEGEFDWSPKTQGYILASFFYGYVFPQLLGGLLAERFGGKWVLGASVFIPGLLTLLTPLAARLHVNFLICIRLLSGVFAAPAFPSAMVIWGRWIPPLERSIIPPLANTGKDIGIVVTTIIASQLCTSRFFGGWPSAFYVFGILSCFWFVGWCRFVYNSPSEHPQIAHSEKLYLRRCIPKTIKAPIPWIRILKCVPLYGVCVQHFCTNFIFYVLLTSLPTYFSTILRFNLRQNGLMFAIPYLVQLVFTIVIGQFADRIRRKKILSTTATRRWQTIIGACGTTIFLVLVAYVKCNHVLAVTFISLAVGFISFQSTGSLISHLDIASNYAGTLMGITNTFASIPGILGPIFVGWMTEKNQTLEAWKTIYNVSAAACVVGALVYCILFDGEEQSWNRDETEE